MKNITLKKTAETQITSDLLFTNSLRTAVLEAIQSVDGARQMCMAVGQMLNEVKARCAHGEFVEKFEKLVPEVSQQTINTWMRAAANIAKALPAPSIDIESVSVVLHTPDDQLTPGQLKYKQDWFDFTEGKTIKDACAGVFVDGDEAHRIDRCVNGKTQGGKGKLDDRKAVEKFTATKLKHITTFLTTQTKATAGKRVTGWRDLPPVQKTAISAAFNQFLQTAPPWLLENIADQIHIEKRLSKEERLAR